MKGHFSFLSGLLGVDTIIQGVADLQLYAGTPTAGSAQVQVLTINGSPDGGTFRFQFQGVRTVALAWNTPLLTMQAALNALPGIGAGGVVVTGTPGANYTITWQAASSPGLLTVPTADMLMTNGGVLVTAPTWVNTPGVSPAPLGVKEGGMASDSTTGMVWVNTGTAIAPIWTKVGLQT